VGVIAPYDFALDDELWRWVPPGYRLHVTRTRYEPLEVGPEQAHEIGDPTVVARAALELATPEPAAVAYVCTSGSFVRGPSGEDALVQAMTASGIPAAVTTSGALLEALARLGVRRLGVATPYDEEIAALLATYLRTAEVEPVTVVNLGLPGRIWTVGPDVTRDLVRDAARVPCDAVFLSCTNVPAYDLIVPLEAELGIPVITANQVTMWAALQRAGGHAVGPGQRLLEPHDLTTRAG
jgi:maleate isomerase